MHMAPCIAYFIHYKCHLLSLDMLCVNAICLVCSSFMYYAMPSCLSRHHICEFCNAILLSQSSYMWIISGHPFFCYVLRLSTMLEHSTTLRLHWPFDTVMENSRVKIRSSEQTMLSDEAHISLVTDSSSEEDSKTDDQSYIHLRCML